MRIDNLLILLFVVYAVSYPAHRREFTIEKTGREIQVNGLLMEWKQDDAKRFAQPPVTFIWDAMHTPSGIAGYILYPVPDTCPVEAFEFSPAPQVSSRRMVMRLDTAPVSANLFYDIDASGEQGAGVVTAEWLLPWDSVGVDSDGRYTVGLAASSSCGDIGDLFIISGHYQASREQSRNYSRRIIVQSASIIILFLLYILLKARAKRLKRK